MQNANRKAEYSVYTYPYTITEDSKIYWERKHTTSDKNTALDEAEKLYKTDQYQKVEVKKLFFDSRQRRKKDQTFKTFEKSRNASERLAGVAAFALLCGIMAMAMWAFAHFL